MPGRRPGPPVPALWWLQRVVRQRPRANLVSLPDRRVPSLEPAQAVMTFDYYLGSSSSAKRGL